MKKILGKNKRIKILFIISFIFYIVTLILFSKSLLSLTGIENLIRYIIIGLLILYVPFILLYNYKKIKKNKYKKCIVLNFFTILLSVLFILSSVVINTIYGSLSNLTESSNLNYTSKLIVLTDEEFTSDSIIGMVSSSDDVEGYVLANIIIQNEELTNEIVYYESYIKMLYDLYSGEIDAAFVQNNYVALYESEEGLEDLYYDTEVEYSYTVTMENNDTVASSDKTFDEPLTFLIMGVDSTVDGLDDSAAFNGDTLMLVTFNPDTLNATMFSIPRDLMVPISCNNNSVAKINSAASYGTSCVIDTVENLTGIEIDYYVKINFKGVVDLVDALGGIEVYVEEPDYDTYDGQMCEQNSDREFGDSLICLDPGLQVLDGEEALAYSRNRKLYALSDIDRIAHQQDVVTAIATKALTVSSYSEFEDILNAISNNIVTNMTTDQMLSAYTVFKSMLTNALSGDDIINIEKSYLEYYDLRVYMPSYGAETAGLGYYKDSLNDIIEKMEINLGLKDEEIITTFSYEIDEEYEQTVAGEGYYGEQSYQTLTDFTSMSQASASSYCNQNGITCIFETVNSDSEYYNSSVATGLIANQSVRDKTLLNLVSTVTLYINGDVIVNSTDTNLEESDSSLDNDETSDDYIDDVIDDLIVTSDYEDTVEETD